MKHQTNSLPHTTIMIKAKKKQKSRYEIAIIQKEVKKNKETILKTQQRNVAKYTGKILLLKYFSKRNRLIKREYRMNLPIKYLKKIKN